MNNFIFIATHSRGCQSHVLVVCRGGEAQHGCLRAVAACLTSSIDEGLELERGLFMELLMGSQSQARRSAQLHLLIRTPWPQYTCTDLPIAHRPMTLTDCAR